MEPDAVPIDPERLLAEDPFVRGLAQQLLRDEHGADDLAQSTWLELLRRPLRAESPRALLATIVRRLAHKQRRGEQRRDARERQRAEPTPVPSPAEIMQREEMRTRVVRAVMALPPEMRDVVVLRFFEQLPPRAIARRLQVPVETVRTRHKRALQRLRQQLDEGTAGGRAAWAVMLLPLARPRAWTSGGSSIGGLWMATNGKVAAAAAVMVLAVGCMWLLANGGDAVSRDAEAAGATRTAAAPSSGAVGLTADTAATPMANDVRTAVIGEAATGELRVRVVRTAGAGGGPAQGILVEARRLGTRHAVPCSGITDDAGLVAWREVVPGKYHVELPARKSEPQWIEAEVPAGGVAERVVTVLRGVTLTGIVVDEKDTPLGGAEVSIADWGGTRSTMVALTAENGTFAVTAIDGNCHVGARCRGHQPSFLQQVTADDGAKVELRIVLARGGASVRGTVRDDAGRPIAGATVIAGSPQQQHRQRKDGNTEMAPRTERTRTDAAGSYLLTDLMTGEIPVAVMAADRAPTSAALLLRDGDEVQHDVVLLAEAQLEGTVRTADGKPAADAWVRGGESWIDTIAVDTRTDERGAFLLRELPLRDVTVAIEGPDGSHLEQVFSPRAGERLHWDAVFEAAREVRGRVLDEEGKPAAQMLLDARSDDWRWSQTIHTDQDGAFHLRGMPEDARIDLRARRLAVFPEVVATGLVPGTEPVVVRLPPLKKVHFAGRVALADGTVPQNVSLSPIWAAGGEGSPVEHIDPATGAFRIGAYPPGDYELAVTCPGYAQLRLPARHFDADFDFGTLTLEVGGTARFQMLWAGASLPPISTTVFDRNGHAVTTTTGEGNVQRTSSLPAGDYLLQIGGDGVVSRAVPFTIRTGIETTIDVPLRTGVRVAVEITGPREVTGMVPVTILAADGSQVLRSIEWAARGKASMRAMLDPGRYRVIATHGERRVEQPFDLAAGDGARWELRLP